MFGLFIVLVLELGTHEDLLTEVLAGRSNEELEALKAEYQQNLSQGFGTCCSRRIEFQDGTNV